MELFIENLKSLRANFMRLRTPQGIVQYRHHRVKPEQRSAKTDSVHLERIPVKETIRKIALGLIAVTFLGGCDLFKSKSEPAKEEASTTSTLPLQSNISEQSTELLLASHPLAEEWKKIWEQKNQLQALRDFKNKHGVFLETLKKVGDLAFTIEGPCESYISLVTNTKDSAGYVTEITAQGKKVRQWRIGDGELLRVENGMAYRQISYYENPINYATLRNEGESPSHTYVLAIDQEGFFSLNENNEKNSRKWDAPEIQCPSGLKEKSEFNFCIQDSKTKRIFVLEHSCT